MSRFVSIAKQTALVVGVISIGAGLGGSAYWQFHDRIPYAASVGVVAPPIAWEQMFEVFLWMVAGALIFSFGAFAVSRIRRFKSHDGSDA